MNLLFDERMRTSDPASGLTAYEPERRHEIIDRAIAATPPTKGRRPRARVLLAACAALVVVGLGYQSVTASIGTAQAADVLSRAAIGASDPPAKPGQYWEITRIGTNLVGTADGGIDRMYLVRTAGVDYVAVDGRRPSWFVRKPSETIRQVLGPAAPRDSRGSGDSWTSNLSPEQRPAWWGEPSPSWFASLPRDTARLRERLYADTAGHGSNPDDEAFVYVADVLRSGVVPAEVRSALYRVLKTIPGTTVTEQRVTMEDGRSGVAIGRNDIFGSHNELVIDPKTGQLIGERSFMRLIPIVGERIAFSTGVQRRLVDAVPPDVRRTATRQTCRVVNGEVECD